AAPLADQLAKAVQLDFPELLTIQRLLLREMTALKDEAVTRTLIELCSSERTPPDLLKGARNALAARRNGAAFLMAALEKHYDLLGGVLRPPPVGPIADALGAMNEKQAAPLLAAHLNDPDDTPDDVQRAATALVTLATKNELAPIATFFAHYRCVDGQ